MERKLRLHRKDRALWFESRANVDLGPNLTIYSSVWPEEDLVPLPEKWVTEMSHFPTGEGYCWDGLRSFLGMLITEPGTWCESDWLHGHYGDVLLVWRKG